MYRYDEEDERTAPYGWEEVPDTDLPVWAVLLGAAGVYIGRALLVLGVVCFIVVGMFLAVGGAP